MDLGRWERTWEIFEGALALAPGLREAFLHEACAGDAVLREEVASLLTSHDGAGEFLERAVSGAASDLVGDSGVEASEDDLAPGSLLGAWRILREIGRGGMGAVWLAERADGQFRGQAAVKILREGGGERLRRFLAERQILAGLDHPHIARLLDGGATATGAPYVVMEYVDGEPIDAYCDRRRLPVAERLRLFRDVCGAVQHAHRSLVVHRDIKPANVLVTAGGAPKLLDFGIAKLLDPAGAGARETRAGTRLLTPEYASPEQVLGGPITTASDVYSLGVLLHELLAGRLPYGPSARTAPEIERAVTESEPTRPSAAADAAAAAARSTTPARLRSLLAGDLDNIVLTALRKEPRLRYASPDALAEDVRRHLEGRPVAARPPAAAYRLSKFVRRHPWGSAAGAGFVTALAALGVLLAAQSARLARERDRALAAEARARAEAASAEEVAAFLVDLFKVADPEEARGRQVPVREVLDRGARRIGGALRGEPEVQARLLRTLGDVYSSLGLMDEALRLSEQGLALNRSLHGAEHPEVAGSLAAVGAIRALMGDRDAADRDLAASLDMRRRLLGRDHIDVVDSLLRLSRLREAQGRLEEAEALAGEALGISREAAGPRHERTAACLNSLGWIVHVRGRSSEAEGLLREALEIRERLLGGDHPDVGTTLGNLGQVLRGLARYEEAEAIQTRNFEMVSRVFGPEHYATGLALNNLSALLKEKGDPARAEALQREAFEIFRKAFGEEHHLVILALNNLANLRQDQGDLDGAVAIHRRGLALARKVHGSEHPRVGDILNNLANALWDGGDYDAAEAAYREALGIDRKLLGGGHPYVAMDLNNLALVLRDRGDLDAAEPLVEEALAIQRKAEGDEGATTSLYVGSLGMLYLRMGRTAEAERLVRESLRVQELRFPADHWRILQTRAFLGECLAQAGRLDEAEELLVAGADGLEKALGRRSGVTRRAHEAAAALFEKTGRPERAAAYRSSR